MKIIQITNQHRRDFTAIYKCEGCEHQETKGGYDDHNFHANVVPAMKCNGCGKSRNDLGIQGEVMQTKYPEGMTI